MEESAPSSWKLVLLPIVSRPSRAVSRAVNVLITDPPMSSSSNAPVPVSNNRRRPGTSSAIDPVARSRWPRSWAGRTGWLSRPGRRPGARQGIAQDCELFLGPLARAADQADPPEESDERVPDLLQGAGLGQVVGVGGV